MVRVLRWIGALFVVFSVIGGLILIQMLLSARSQFYIFNGKEADWGLFALGVGMLIFYFLLGVGLVLRTRWGLVLLKVFLYFMLLIFPIGTVLSLYLLRVLRRHAVLVE